MVIIKEGQKLDEMAVLRVSSNGDGLPFRITVQSPETHHEPHAHIRDLDTGKIKLGEFAITKNPPKNYLDIKDFRDGISGEQRIQVLNWSSGPFKKFPGLTNWVALWGNWLMNVDA